MLAEPLTNVILSFPSILQLAADSSKGTAPRSWIQLARTGSFQSARYGKFAITKGDLAQMLFNFENVTPKSPTELPIDFDHLSMNPKKPGDGKAAGWMKKLELREDGNELWGEIEWTPDGATHIEKREYKFVSPSFVKDHTHKDGRKIGTCLLAAAITNHPFLEGMKALTLYNFGAMGDLGLAETPTANIDRAVHLAEIGQRIGFTSDAEVTPELNDGERAQTFIVKSTIGGGDDQFVRLTTADGQEFGWFRATQLAPAAAFHKENPMPKDTTPNDAMQTTLRRVADARGIDLSKDLATALKLVDEEAATAYLGQFDSGAARPEPTGVRPVNVHNLHRDPDEGYAELVTRVSREQRLDLRSAQRMCAESFPELAGQYERGETL